MQILYTIVLFLAKGFIPIASLFNKKMALFYKGRQQTFQKLQQKIGKADQTIWMHCASLGEFEQGRPVLEKLKLEYPKHKLVLSFFSPSGYEVRKDYKIADVVVYLPLDTTKNAKRFLEKVHPSLVIFIKYEFWPNILAELKKHKIPTLLVSGIFRADQIFFRKNIEWFQKSLKTFTHFFVQNNESIRLLNSINHTNVSLSGDTRFDRVFDIVKNKKELPLIKLFTENSLTLVAGSTWEKDEELLVHYINTKAIDKERFIIAPHTIKQVGVEKLIRNISKKTLRYSEATLKNIQNAEVLIVDSIGILTSVYAYASFAYVGGGFGAGIHNILEPATYGIPVLIGPKYQKFQEAVGLVEKKACFEIQNQESLNQKLTLFFSNSEFVKKSGKTALHYIQNHIGATNLIIEYIKKQIKR